MTKRSSQYDTPDRPFGFQGTFQTILGSTITVNHPKRRGRFVHYPADVGYLMMMLACGGNTEDLEKIIAIHNCLDVLSPEWRDHLKYDQAEAEKRQAEDRSNAARKAARTRKRRAKAKDKMIDELAARRDRLATR